MIQNADYEAMVALAEAQCGNCRLGDPEARNHTCRRNPFYLQRVATEAARMESIRQRQLTVVPCELADANAFVEELHRHHKKAQGHRWSTAVRTPDGTTHGVAIVGRPVARNTDQRRIVEAVRVCTDGTPNACSALYGAVCRQAKAHGYEKAQTFILESEPGTSLRAAGWKPVALTDGGTWSRPSRGRDDKAPLDRKVRWECACSTLPPIGSSGT